MTVARELSGTHVAATKDTRASESQFGMKHGPMFEDVKDRLVRSLI